MDGLNIIVLDLEWNQSPYGKGTSKRELPFEIVEIGAVKLDADGNEIGRFSEKVCPQVYRRLHHITAGILNVTMEELQKADHFSDVADRFFEWCGTEYRFATWGVMDLTELQRNCDYFSVPVVLEKPLFYYDIQKIHSIYTKGNCQTLESVIEGFQIEKDEPFHQALSDAVYTAKIMKCLPKDMLDTYISVDYHQNPKNRKEEIELKYPKASLFVSMEYENKEAAMLDKKLKSLPCVICGRRIKKKIRWFSDSSSHFYCLGLCSEDGYLMGKINLKKTLEGRVFGVKNICLVDEERAGRLREKKEQLRKRRREKRRQSRSRA